MSVSPAINIGIGEVGNNIVADIKEHFFLREEGFLPYMSFHQSAITENGAFITTANSNGAFVDNDKLLNSYEFSQYAYGHLVNLLNLLEKSPYFFNIQLNFFISSYDTEACHFLNQFISDANQLTQEGVFGSIGVKCFYIVSNGDVVINKKQNAITQTSLDDFLSEIKTLNIPCQAFIIDNKNTQTVFLGSGFDYLPFALSELILAFMIQEYEFLANLENRQGIYAFGIGMVYFDELYFRAFFRNRILRRTLLHEKLIGDKVVYDQKEKYQKLAYQKINPFCMGDKKDIDIVNSVQNALPDKETTTLRDYQYFLERVLYRNPGIDEKYPEIGKYNLEDAIYAKMYYEYYDEESIKELGLLPFQELESLHDDVKVLNDKLSEIANDISDLKRQLSELNEELSIVLSEDSVDTIDQISIENSKIQLIEKIDNKESKYQQKRKDIEEIESKLSRHAQSKREEFSKFTAELKYEDLIDSLLNKISVHNLKVKEASADLEIANNEYSEAGFFKKLWKGKKLKVVKEQAEKSKNSVELQLMLLNQKLKSCEKIKELFDFEKQLKEELIRVNEGVKSLISLESEYQRELNELPFLNHVYLQNILSNDLMVKYEKMHSTTLQRGLNKQLKKLSNHKTISEFLRENDSTINRNISSIIDFHILEYMTGKYENKNLFLESRFEQRLADAKNSEHPFVNIVQGHQIKPHQLRYYNRETDIIILNDIESRFKNNYTGPPPIHVSCLGVNKFALISIGIIDDVNKIVKYNLQESD